jgi:hypothetical protein
MIYEPVWVSTVDHLIQFKIITIDTSAAIKRGGRYNVPDNFPQTRIAMFLGLAYSSPSPLIMFSNGVLDLRDHRMSYKASSFHLMGNQVRNLQDDLEFTVTVNEIISLEHYLFVSPINKIFSISFTRVHSTREGFLRDFLVCVGSQGLAFKQIRKANEDLFDALTTFTGK